MSKSIMQKNKECYLCRMLFDTENTYNLHEHHCISGTANRKLAEHYGLKVYLCFEHHEGSVGVHSSNDEGIRNKKMLAKCAMEAFMEKHGDREDFIRTFGKAAD